MPAVSTPLRRVGWLVVTGLFVLAWLVWLRPISLGGRTGYVIVSGRSMLPTLHPGDLVLLERQRHYRTGDVVAYRLPDREFRRARIIHRIIGGSAPEGFVVQGDNKPEADPWRPRPSDIVGRQWVRIPRLGVAAAIVRSPFVFAAIVGGVVFSIAYTRGPRRQRKPEA